MIGGKAPSEYLRQLQTHKSVELNDAAMNALLATHRLEPVFLREDDFEGFIASRRNLLISEISRVMGKPVETTGEAVADDDESELGD